MTPVFPKEGTRAHEEFMMRARDPNSLEASMMRQVVGDATQQTQQVVRQMLHQMIDLVPGQLFRDIARFHGKFGLHQTDDPQHRLPDDVLSFRIKFLMEELREYIEATGMAAVIKMNQEVDVVRVGPNVWEAEKAFDALIDLAYVCLGTAFLHRFPFNEGWARVQEANMAKVRADSQDDPRSIRKHAKDVVKPEGWKPPVLADLLDEPCPRCSGQGDHSVTWFNKETHKPDEFLFEFCKKCSGTGRRRRILDEDACKLCHGVGLDIHCMAVGERPDCESCKGTGRRDRGSAQEAST